MTIVWSFQVHFIQFSSPLACSTILVHDSINANAYQVFYLRVVITRQNLLQHYNHPSCQELRLRFKKDFVGWRKKVPAFQGTNIFLLKAAGKMIFLQRWGMLGFSSLDDATFPSTVYLPLERAYFQGGTIGREAKPACLRQQLKGFLPKTTPFIGWDRCIVDNEICLKLQVENFLDPTDITFSLEKKLMLKEMM